MSKILAYTICALALALVLGSCNQEDDPIIPEDTDFFVSFEINGTAIRFENGVDDYGNGPGRVSYLDGVGPLNSQFTLYSTSLEDPNFGKNTFKIQMVEVKPDSISPTYQETYQLFTEGSYDYGSTIEDSITGGINGVVIEYVDADSTVWTSDAKIDMQENWADFEITSHEDSGSDLFGGKTSGTFNCRVFNNGNHLDLTSGMFRARTVFKEQ
jgi:hypothetical protein